MRIPIFLLATLALPALAAGQVGHGQTWESVTWSMSAPTANTKDFASPFSFRGVNLSWRKRVGGRAAAGLDVGWSVLNEETAQTSTFDQADITGQQFRYFNAFPILASIDLGLGNPHGVHPLLGLSVGTYYIERELDIGLWAISDNNWHVGLVPSLGLLIPLGGGMDDATAIVRARYNYAFASGQAPYQSWLGIDVGFAFAP